MTAGKNIFFSTLLSSHPSFLLFRFKGELPEGRHMKVHNKNFYFDIGQNNRGIYMRISEVRVVDPTLKFVVFFYSIFKLFFSPRFSRWIQVKGNFRTAITVPENCWSRFRDILSDYCDKMKKSSESATITADNTLQTTSSNSN